MHLGSEHPVVEFDIVDHAESHEEIRFLFLLAALLYGGELDPRRSDQDESLREVREQLYSDDEIPLHVRGGGLGQNTDPQAIRHPTQVFQTDAEAAFARLAVGTEVGDTTQKECHGIATAVVFFLVGPLLRTQHARLACKDKRGGDA